MARLSAYRSTLGPAGNSLRNNCTMRLSGTLDRLDRNPVLAGGRQVALERDERRSKPIGGSRLHAAGNWCVGRRSSSSIFVSVALRNVNARMGTAQAGLKTIRAGSTTRGPPPGGSGVGERRTGSQIQIGHAHVVGLESLPVGACSIVCRMLLRKAYASPSISRYPPLRPSGFW